MGEFLKGLIVDILIAVAIAGAVLFFIRPTVVKQTSMQDTLNPNDYIILYKRAYVSNEPERGDIVVFESELADANGNDKLLIKRVIGLPGDTIDIVDEQVYLNGEVLDEDYIKDGVTPAVEGNHFEVPDGAYFMMGDNRVVSVDSRYSEVGYVSKDLIKGKAVIRLFPFTKIKTL